MKAVRCAIYTRKSSEEGLEQDFNSLDAQYAACAAYIASQAGEGWSLVSTRYDDGGISGGTLERPGLTRLMKDISTGLIDIVVVYKVDRLTRSLLDFSKLVEAFDKAGASFVSVTQSFNTTNSMGRLTLNMLLSFAQFEREVTAERIRDKIAASKQRGMWMGGTPPIGYQPAGRSLTIVEDEAKLVVRIFNLYLKLGTVSALHEQLLREGINQPLRSNLTGRTYGGVPFHRAQIYRMLNNPLYIGRICHRDQSYPGKHSAIISNDLWEKVQAQLSGNTQGEQLAPKASDSSLLVGRIFDADGAPLVASHASKRKVRYRYYVSRHLQHGRSAKAAPGNADAGHVETPHASDVARVTTGGPSLRIPAREIEPLVVDAIKQRLSDPVTLAADLGLDLKAPHATETLISSASAVTRMLAIERGPALRPLITRIITRVEVQPDAVQLILNADGLRRALKLPQHQQRDASADTLAPADIRIAIPVRLKRSGMAVRLVLDTGVAAVANAPDAKLLTAIGKGRAWWTQLQANPQMTIADLARAENLGPTYVDRILRLAFLAPGVVQVILEGTAPADLTLDRLKDVKLIAPAWAQQYGRLRVTAPNR